jgi:peroxiredoxin
VDAARDRFAAAGCSVLVVSQAEPDTLARYLSRRAWHVPVVADPERVAYAAFRLERTGWLTFFRPKVVWGYFRGMARGYGVKAPHAGEDVLQLGGDFVLNRRGEVVFAYRSADPADRPTVAALLGAVASAGPMPAEPLPDPGRVDRPSAGA